MAKTSMKSTALESRVSLHEHGAATWLGQLTTRYGLPAICVVLVIVFFTDNAFVCFPVDAAGHSR